MVLFPVSQQPQQYQMLGSSHFSADTADSSLLRLLQSIVIERNQGGGKYLHRDSSQDVMHPVLPF